VLDGRLVSLEGAPFGLLPTPAEALPQQFPHADGAVVDTELRRDQRGNALERPQLRGVPSGARASQEQLPKPFLLDLRQPWRAAGNSPRA
jgi:hypothetical protein